MVLASLSHRQKRMKQIKKMVQRGLLDPNKDDPFELFISSTNIRYCYYKETHKILGTTFGMLILQDFEALTPNLLARTIETVEGGGIVVLLLRTMNSLKQLYTMAMVSIPNPPFLFNPFLILCPFDLLFSCIFFLFRMCMLDTVQRLITM